MKCMSLCRAHMFFWCVIFTANFVYGFRIMNTTSDKLLIAIRTSTQRVNVNLEPSQLSKELANDAESIQIADTPPTQIASLADAKGSKLELTDETILYIVKVGNAPTITAVPPDFIAEVPAAPPAPYPFNSPSAPAGSGSEAGDSKKAAESETTQSTGGTTVTYTVTPVQTSTSTGERSTDAKREN